MGLEWKQTSEEEEVPASPRLLGGSSNGGSIESPQLPRDVLTSLPPEDQRRLSLAAAVRFMADVKAIAGEDRHRQLVSLLVDHKENGLHMRVVLTRVEELFQGHRDLLVACNTFLPEGFQCTVPSE